ncbi:MAG: rhomboid family intramembrane serine protease [Actinobacteria bacterium]|nr:rhomboid family intramembrane serine protease [Actinomycetota bacterium]
MVLPVGDINPTHRTPFVTLLLLAANVLVFLLVQPHLGGVFGEDIERMTQREAAIAFCTEEAFYLRWAAIPEEILDLQPLTEQQVQQVATRGCEPFREPPVTKPVILSIFTALFLHAGLGHLLGNMLFLWIFGNNVEDRLGHVRFLLFYAIGGVAATYAFALFNRGSLVPLLGASGAIAAVLGAYLLLFPHARIRVYAPFPLYFLAPLVGGRIAFWFLIFAIVELPAFLVLLLWFGLQVLASAQPLEGGIAFEAHAAGFLAGMLMVALVDRDRTRQRRTW